MTDREMVRLEAGSVVALRLYDLGRSVDVDALSRAGAESERVQFPAGDAGLRYERPPVELMLGDVEVPLEERAVFADVTVRVFDCGIAAVALRVLVGGMDWDRFTERVEEVSAATAGRASIWNEVDQRVRRALESARLKVEGEAIASHVFVIARRFGATLPHDEIVDGDYAAAIVSRDWVPLTSLAQAELMRGTRAAGRDLVVIGEERSFIVEPAAGSGVPDAVEAALVQRALVDALGTERADARAAGARLTRAESMLRVSRGRLAGVLSTARDRLGVAEAEAYARRRLGGAGAASGTGSLARTLLVAVVAAAVTALVFLVLG